jgi:hypothetical protein
MTGVIFAIGIGFAAAVGIAPGEWKLAETVITNGQRTPTPSRTRCLSSEQASDTAKTFSPEFATVNSGCRQVEFTATATLLRWHMQCTGQLDMDVSGEFNFHDPKHYSATIISKGAILGQTFVDTSVAIKGEHIGTCR